MLDWNDADLRFVDLTGDGVADILITEDVAFRWHPSLLGCGFGTEVRLPTPTEEDEGPRILFSDPAQSIYLADMSGDGLTDIVRIRNGEVCYWPNRGYGRFGAKIVMDRSPWFDAPNLFDNRRIRLADTDGSGTTDILYVAADRIHVYLNEAGNALSLRKTLTGLPAAQSAMISVVDFLGRGTACLVWSSPLPADAQRPLRYVDLMRGVKPHLLSRISNNLGAQTVLTYASSTEFYLADRAAGRPWLTPLPFPVHVLTRVEVYDAVSRHRFVSTVSYHHGYYDAVEREFRGFGRVDRIDAEAFDTGEENAFPDGANDAATWRLAPVLTKTWYHTGVFLGVDRVSRHLAHEYYREPGETAEMRLADTVLPPGLMPEEARDACRGLKGMELREEIYALDGTDASARPYTVAEGNATLRVYQPRAAGNRYCVVFSHARENRSMDYERRLYPVAGTVRADARLTQSVTLDVDDYGNPLKAATIAHGRRFPDPSLLLNDADRANQARALATATVDIYTNAIDTVAAYCTPAIAETRSYELVHLPARSVAHPLQFAEIRRLVEQAEDGHHDLPFEDVDAAGATEPVPYRRLIAAARTLYRADNLEWLLPLGEIEALALPGESRTLTLTRGLIAQVYGDKLADPEAVLQGEGGYVADAGGSWWARSGRLFYSPSADDDPAAELAHARRHFYLPIRFRDPFGNVSHIGYDTHDLVPIETRDPLGNTVHERLDYRVLTPCELVDPNGNRMRAAFDALARLAGTAVMGKVGERLGDSLDDFAADLPDEIVLAHLRNPLADPYSILGSATARTLYDPFAFARTRDEAQPHPAVTYSLVRETHVADLAPGEQTRVQHNFCYSDGFARQVQRKIQAEPGPVPERGQHHPNPRWVGTGWTIFNNKGKPVRQYEPFFTATHEFEFAAIFGVAATLIYDPPGRVVAALHPNHTYQKTVFDAWGQQIWDLNDTVLTDPREDPDIGPLIQSLPAEDCVPTWYVQRAGGALGRAERDAATKTAAHAGTPSLAFLDALGRPFLTVAHNRTPHDGGERDEFYALRSTLDIQGNQRAVTDALGRVVMTYDYDIRQIHIHQLSADAGERWTIGDVAGKPLLRFDSRHHRLRDEYDPLRRSVALFVREGEHAEKLAERVEYGEGQPDAAAYNLLGRIVRQFDGAGIGGTPAYDFKGNLLTSTRQALADFRDQVDWAASPRLEDEVRSSETTYDALNRPTALTAPDRSVVRPTYNDANLLDRLDVALRGSGNFTRFITNIDYDAKGQRQRIDYGNGARTRSSYDPLTFRLVHIKTTRATDDAALQDLHYVYDPVGNVSSVADHAQETVYFCNQVVSARGDYYYDAVYRLIDAAGREHAGRPGHPETNFDDAGRIHLPLPGDGHAMRNYREHYRYDAVGNILELIHTAPGHGNWHRHYRYGEIDTNNRLTGTRVGDHEGHYAYDDDGNMTRMPHLPEMRWNFKDQLAATRAQVVNDGSGAPTTFYVYDAGGRRARKVTIDSQRKRRADRIYVGAFEEYREYGSDGEAVTLQRTTLNILDNSRPVALVETRDDERTIRYQFDNHLGSACLELDADAAILTYEEYYPYGSTSYQSGRSVAEASLKRYRFTGEERDTETGFNYHSARYFAPWLARWTSCDPAGLVDSTNLFQYASLNPLRHVDPSGKAPTPPPGLIGDHPLLAKLWNQAVEKVVDPKYGATAAERIKGVSDEARAIAAKAGRLGSNREAGTAINFGRKTYSRVRTAFGQLAKEAGVSMEGVQLHHAIDQVAKNPGEAINPWNVSAVTGNATVAGTLHNKAHAAYDAVEPLLEKSKEAAKAIAPEVEEALPKVAKVVTSESGEVGTVLRGAKAIPVVGKVVTGILIGVTVLAATEQVASAATTDKPPADDAEKMAQTFEKGEKIVGGIATAATLIPGPPGLIIGGAQANVAIAEAGIQHTGGDDRIVAAGKATEQFAKAHGWTDVNAETAGSVAAAVTSIGEGARVIGEVAAGPVDWGMLALRTWKKF